MLQLGSKPPELSARVTFHSQFPCVSNLPCHGYKSQIHTLHACAQLEREKRRSVNAMGFLASAAEKSQQLTVQFIVITAQVTCFNPPDKEVFSGGRF